MIKKLVSISFAFTLIVTAVNSMAANDDNKIVQRGKYIVQISGCNDCHTPGYAQNGGNIPVTEWLTGSSVGFAGPWGVTYPKNLRNLLATMTEEEWITKAHSMKSRPPMPWFALRDMSDADLRALYRFVHSLGKHGKDAPEYIKPGVAVKTPYIEFFPKNLPAQANAK